MSDTINACIRTRQIAADTFAAVLRGVLGTDTPISEAEFCRQWLAELHTHSELHEDGWYTPPPHGIFAQFATDADPARVRHDSNRPQEAWPRDDIFLDRKHGIVTAYASPVDRVTGMIGDFGITLYFGDKPEIKTLLRKMLEIDIALYEELRPGMTLAEVAKRGIALMHKAGLQNEIASINDPTGTNIGHSFPASDMGWSAGELAVLNAGDWTAAADLISKRRRFVSLGDTAPVGENFIYTIEPRPVMLDRPDLPMTSFHTIVVWERGQKKLVTNFGDIFTLAGMDYMPVVDQ